MSGAQAFPFTKNTSVLQGRLAFPRFYDEVHARLERWIGRFLGNEDASVFKDLELLFLSAPTSFLANHSTAHLFKLILAIHSVQKKLFLTTALSKKRQIEIKWIPTHLLFPFSSKPVMGCLVGANMLNRYELFDQENILLILRKNFPQFHFVGESIYQHPSNKKHHKMLYFEIEKQDGKIFSLKEQIFLRQVFGERIKNSIEQLSPTVFMQRNEEEVCKNILTLSQEIYKTDDLPQAIISLEQQTAGEIVFLVTMVYFAPNEGFSFQDYFADRCFELERKVPVKYLGDRLIEAHVFRIKLDRHPSLLRSDGSWDFYLARQKSVSLLRLTIGVFRDFNGGILIKQQELLQNLKEAFFGVDRELLETFFYAITPLEKQVSLPHPILKQLFSLFLESRNSHPEGRYTCHHQQETGCIFLSIKFSDVSLRTVLLDFMKQPAMKDHDVTFNMIQLGDEFFFQLVGVNSQDQTTESFVSSFKTVLAGWEGRVMRQKVLRLGFEYSFLSLDPRLGGESISQVMAGLLFEGLTRYDNEGHVELAIAGTIVISSDGLQYTFKLQPCCWNDSSALTAYDFEYAWKKVLSPDFQASFTYLFYPIRGAKQAKEGKIPLDEVGIQVVDAQTLKVVLNHPTPYFLELVSHPIYSPIHRLVDQQYPQWPYQGGADFPCNGPFSIDTHHTGTSYKLVKNPYYWGAENIAVDTIVFNKMHASQAFQAFRQGEIDWLGHPLISWTENYAPAATDTGITFAHASVCWQVFNTSQWPFCNHKIRHALSYLVDRAAFCTTASIALVPAFSVLLPRHIQNPEARFPDPNHAAARRLWKEGWSELGVREGQIPSLSFIYHHKGMRDHVVGHLRRQMQEVLGAECHLEPLPWGTFFERMTQGHFQMGLMQWMPWVNDPIYTLNSFRFQGEDTNFSKWRNTFYQQLLEKSDDETHAQMRLSYLAQAEQILCQDVPVIPLFYQPFQALLKKGFNVSSHGSRAVFNLATCFYKK